MFQPILMVARVTDLREARRPRQRRARSASPPAATATTRRCATSSTTSRPACTYVNRPQGATTGAWPGYQAFGGWKGSGSTGKAIGSFYYLPLYLREQSQTVVE